MAALVLPVAIAQAVSWSTAGGDQGRSGLQPLTAGSAPFESMWSAQTPAGRGPATPVVITNGGPGPRAPRVAYGTADGVIHLHSLYTGETVGPAGGIPISQSHVPWTFSGFDGLAGIVDSSTEAGLGQLFVVYNDVDQANRFNNDPLAQFTDDVAIAQIDAESGQLINDLPIPGTDEFQVSSQPLLTPPTDDGTRQLLFTVVNKKDWQEQYGRKEDNEATPMLIRLTIRGARNISANIDFDNMETTAVDFLNPLASPSLMNLSDESVAAPRPPAQPTPPVPHVAIGTANPDSPIVSFVADDLATTGPSSPKLDRDASDVNLAIAGTPTIPVTPSGIPPGSKNSSARRAPAVLFTMHRPLLNRTIVHRLVPNAAGDGLVESVRSASYTGKPAAQLATSQAGAAPGTSAGVIILATDRNLYALKGGDLSLAWKLDRNDSLKAGSTGFTKTSPTVAAGAVLISRDNGEPLAIDLKTGDVLGGERFRPDPGQAGSQSAFGPPAAAGGVVVYSSDRGVFAYRNRCGNVLRGSGQNEALIGTLAGDDITTLAGTDTVEGREGDDCVDAGAHEDVVDAGPGDDLVKGGGGQDRLMGRDGNDTLEGNDDDDQLIGDEGNDELSGGVGEDVAKGGNGADTIFGGEGADILSGNGDADRLEGGPGADRLKGSIGDDRVIGGGGSDRLDAGPGNDIVNALEGADEVFAGNGDDRVYAVDGRRDVIHCGEGSDTVDVDRGDRVLNCEKVRIKKHVPKKKRKRKRSRR